MRSPLDAITSFFHMVGTGTHNCSVHDEDFDLVLFEEFVKQEIEIWKDFHEYWMTGPLPIPTLLVKFEDLKTKSTETLNQVFKFLLNTDDLTGTRIESLINAHALKSTGPEVYKPRAGKIGQNLDKFSTELIDHIWEVSRSMIERLGYQDLIPFPSVKSEVPEEIIE